MKTIVLLILAILLKVIDCWSTIYLLNQTRPSGKPAYREQWPPTRWLIEQIGLVETMVISSALFAIWCVALFWVFGSARWLDIFLAIVCFYMVVFPMRQNLPRVWGRWRQ